MGIVRDNAICCNGKLHLETLTHIFLNCPHTKSFIILLRSFILLKVDPMYRDQNPKTPKPQNPVSVNGRD